MSQRIAVLMMILGATGCGSGRIVQVACGPASCTGCCTNAGQCVGGQEVDACGADGVACLACSPEATCQAGACVSPSLPPPEDAGVLLGDNCARPIVGLSPSGTQYALPFAGLGRDSPGCGAPSPDAVVQLDMPSAGRLVIELTPSDVAQAVSASLAATCVETGAERCATAPSGTPLVFVADVSAPGPVWLWVSSSTAAPVGLGLRLETADRGATCAAPLPIQVRRGRGVIALPMGTAVSSPACAMTAASPSTVLALDIAGTDRLAFSLANSAPGTALGLSAGSCAGQDLGCVATTSILDLGVTAAGLLLGTVSAASATTLEWSLASDAPGESCFEPIDLGVVDGAHPVSTTGSLLGAQDDVTTPCGTRGAPDRLYRFHTTQTQTVRVVATSPSGMPLAVAVGSGTCGTAWGQCSGTGTVVLPYLPAGTFFVAVEGTGDYALQVEHLALSVGDSCTSPFVVVLPPDGGPLIVHGDTSFALDDMPNLCGPDGPDQVWKVAAGSFASYRATLRALDGGTFTLMASRYGSCGYAINTDCLASPADGGPAAVAPTVSSNSDSYLWAEGAAGPYELTLQGALPELGSSCDNPVTFVLDGGAQHFAVDWSGDRHIMGNSGDYCGAPLLEDGFLVLQQPANLLTRISVQMLTDGVPAGLFGSSGYSSSAPACPARFGCVPGPYQFVNNAGATPTQTIVAVEGVSATGSTQVTVDVSPVPLGDMCENAEPLVADAGVDGGWSLAVNGDLTDAGADVRCFCPTAKPDHVYSVFLPRRSVPVQVRVQPLTAFVPRIQWLLACNCSGFSGALCNPAPDAGLAVSFNVNSSNTAAPMTLVVVAESGPAGPFLLTITPL